jgi:6-phosphogluconolactonase
VRGTLIICADAESLAREAARRLAAAVETRARTESAVRLALAGGATPRRLYELLASPEFQPRIPWAKLHLFWSDERLVPPDHPDRNYRLAREALLRHAPLPRENIHPVTVQSSPEATALAYEQELRAHFRQRRGVPAFDVILLGLGADGHTASLFPRALPLAERERLVVAAYSPLGGAPRVTFTLPLLNQAAQIFFLVAGEDKAAALRLAVEAPGTLPAQLVAPRGKLLWLADTAAAGQLHTVRVAPAVANKAEP